MKILVVDDERAVRESLRRALELEGYEIELAEDGGAALAFLDRCLDFTYEVERAVREEVAAGTHSLRELTDRVNERFGPYPEFPNELVALVRAVAAV